MAGRPLGYQYAIQGEMRARGGKYDVKSYTYPEDLFGGGAYDSTTKYQNGPDKYANSWVMININVLTSSESKRNYGSPVSLEQNERKSFTEREARGNDSRLLAAGTVAGVTAGAAVLGGIKAKLSGGDYIRAGSDAISTGIGTAVALTPLLINGAKETKRIKTAIQLPMPNNLLTNYGAQWSEEDTAMFDMAMRATNALSPDALMKLLNGDLATTAGNVAGQLGDAATSISLGAQSFLGAGGVSASTGLAVNPKKEQIFRGMNFRQFNMTYTFYPKSESEAQNVHNIIAELKYHMHPEFKTEGRFTFIYPSEFDITFYTGGKENLWVTRIATCVLTDLNVNYTPQGKWVGKSSENGFEGYPNIIDVQMTFRELSLMTKETIEKGF
jgi:hypothetical protein